MVGTAVYQVGFASSSHWKNFSALKPGVQTTDAPAESDDEHRRDQAVDVEQRHDVQAAVGRRQRQRLADVAAPRRRRSRWLSGTIFGREVVPEVCRTSAMSPASAGPVAPAVADRLAGEAELPGRRVGVGLEPQDRHAELRRRPLPPPRCRPRRAPAPWR